ncbi:base plate wedge subunit [Eurybiavirus PHM1]|uniref:Base plate wedge subunit n=1 Tax=Prochlorococcus phage P-HM1 TaxID=445700 RepID=E3SMR6_9CAUD|nr:baseplate wedge subunit [Prochlorococcus phage P-HM1]ADO98709.1 base plate wedge subunit [Prochlorococcus phage P-HM1]
MSLISKSFRDFSLTFEKNAVTNDILSLKNEAAIKESVKNIVLYNFYEKPFDPFFGGNILGLLFENSTPTMVLEVKNRLEQSIEIHEPRVTAVSVTVQFEENRNELNCKIQYLILGISPKFDDISIAFKP